MAIEAASLIARVSADTTSARAELRQFGSFVDQIGHRFRQGIVVGIGFETARKGLDMVRDAFSGVGESIIGFNANLESTQLGLGNMFKDANLAAGALNRIKEIGIEAPFSLDALTQSARMLAAAGLEAEQLVPLLSSVTKAMAGMSQGSEQVIGVTRALGQMAIAGRVNAQDMNQLINAGLPAWKILAEHVGVAENEIKALAESGKIAGTEMVIAFQKFAEANFADALAAKAQTWHGAIEVIQDSIAAMIADAMLPLFEVLRDSAIAFGTWIKESEDAANAVLAFRGALDIGLESLTKFSNILKEGFETDGIAGVADAVLHTFHILTSGMFEAGMQVIETFVEGFLAGADTVLQGAVESVAGIIASFFIGQSPPPMGPLRGIGDAGKSLIDTYVAGMQTANLGELDQLAGQIMGKFTALQLQAGGGATVTEGMKSATEDLQAQIEGAIRVIDRAIDDVDDKIKGVKDTIAGIEEEAEKALRPLERELEKVQNMRDADLDIRRRALDFGELELRQEELKSRLIQDGIDARKDQLQSQLDGISQLKDQISEQRTSRDLVREEANIGKNYNKDIASINKSVRDAERAVKNAKTPDARRAAKERLRDVKAEAKIQREEAEQAKKDAEERLAERKQDFELQKQERAIRAQIRELDKNAAIEAVKARRAQFDITNAQLRIEEDRFALLKKIKEEGLEGQIDEIKDKMKKQIEPLEDQLKVLGRQKDKLTEQKEAWQDLGKEVGAFKKTLDKILGAQQKAITDAKNALKGPIDPATGKPTPKKEPAPVNSLEGLIREYIKSETPEERAALRLKGKAMAQSWIDGAVAQMKAWNWGKIILTTFGFAIGGPAGILGRLFAATFGARLADAMGPNMQKVIDILKTILADPRAWIEGTFGSNSFNLIRNFFVALGAGAAAALLLSSAFGILQPILQVFGTIIGLLATPLGLVVVGVTALALAIRENWFGLGDIFNPIIEAIQRLHGTGELWRSIGQILDSFGIVINNFGLTMREHGIGVALANLAHDLGLTWDHFRILFEKITGIDLNAQWAILQEKIRAFFTFDWEAIKNDLLKQLEPMGQWLIDQFQIQTRRLTLWLATINWYKELTRLFEELKKIAGWMLLSLIEGIDKIDWFLVGQALGNALKHAIIGAIKLIDFATDVILAIMKSLINYVTSGELHKDMNTFAYGFADKFLDHEMWSKAFNDHAATLGPKLLVIIMSVFSVKAMITALKDVAFAMRPAISGFFDDIAYWITVTGPGKIVKAFDDVWSWLTGSGGGKIMGWIDDLLLKLAPFMKVGLKFVKGAGIIGAIIGSIDDLIVVINTAASGLSRLMYLLTGNEQFLERADKLAGEARSAADNSLTAMVTSWTKDMISAAFAGLSSFDWSGFWKTIYEAVGNAGILIFKTINTGLVTTVGNWIKSHIIDPMIAKLEMGSPSKVMTRLMTGVIDGVIEGIKNGYEPTRLAVEAFIEEFKKHWANIGAAVASIDMSAAMTEAFRIGWEALAPYIDSIIEEVRKRWESIGAIISAVDLSVGMHDSFQSGWNLLAPYIDEIIEEIRLRWVSIGAIISAIDLSVGMIESFRRGWILLAAYIDAIIEEIRLRWLSIATVIMQAAGPIMEAMIAPFKWFLEVYLPSFNAVMDSYGASAASHWVAGWTNYMSRSQLTVPSISQAGAGPQMMNFGGSAADTLKRQLQYKLATQAGKNYVGSPQQNGLNFMSTFATGVSQGAPIVERAVRDAFGRLTPYMPESDALKGPLSHLTESGAAIPKTMAAGIHANLRVFKSAGLQLAETLAAALPSGPTMPSWNGATMMNEYDERMIGDVRALGPTTGDVAMRNGYEFMPPQATGQASTPAPVNVSVHIHPNAIRVTGGSINEQQLGNDIAEAVLGVIYNALPAGTNLPRRGTPGVKNPEWE